MLSKNFILALGLSSFVAAQLDPVGRDSDGTCLGSPPNFAESISTGGMQQCSDCINNAGQVADAGRTTCIAPAAATDCPTNTVFVAGTPNTCRATVATDCAAGDRFQAGTGTTRAQCVDCPTGTEPNTNQPNPGTECVVPQTLADCNTTTEVLDGNQCVECTNNLVPNADNTACREQVITDCENNEQFIPGDASNNAQCVSCGTQVTNAERNGCFDPTEPADCADNPGSVFEPANVDTTPTTPASCRQCPEAFPFPNDGLTTCVDAAGNPEPAEGPVTTTTTTAPVEEPTTTTTANVTEPTTTTTANVTEPTTTTTANVTEPTTTTATPPGPSPTGAPRDGIPANSTCEFGTRYEVDGEEFFEACENVITGIRYAAEFTASDEACAAGCAADVNNTINACVGWSRNATTGVCSLFNFIEVVAVPASDLAEAAALRRRQDVITVPGDRAGFPVGSIPDFEALPVTATTTTTTATGTGNVTVTATATTTEVVCVRPGVCVPVFPTSIPFTKTILVPCPTGFEEKVTTVFVGHCGCPETPVPTGPVMTVITTVVPETWKVPGGPTQTVTIPVDGPRAPTADADKPAGPTAGPDATRDGAVPPAPTQAPTIRTEGAKPNPTAPVTYTGGASGHVLGGGVAGAIAALAAAIML